jgi:hypothetical protein
MRIALNDVARPYPAGNRGISWAQAYQRRMRRFNLEVLSVALIALLIAIGFISIEWRTF